MDKLAVCLVAVLIVPVPASGQDAPAAVQSRDAIRIFLDCGHYCDESFLKKEITFVDWMRDRKDADVHVPVTAQSTGGGGTEFTIKFIGLGRFANVEQTLKHVSTSTSTADETRRGIADVLKRGLVRYVRLFKGFSFNVFASASRTRDQINLRGGGASPEEILVRQRQLASGYNYFINFGISYSFGSIFNNIVNPRFGGGGGGEIFFFN